MARKGSVENNEKRRRLSRRYASRRARLRLVARDKSLSVEERFSAQLGLASLPRNSAPSRIRNRCRVTGRSRAYYRRFGMSRIALRSFASQGLLPGVIKASW